MQEIDSFGVWLKERRTALDLTQEALAQRLGCALGTVRKWETEERRPSKDSAPRLAEVLEVPAAEQAVFVKVARGELGADRLAWLSGKRGQAVARQRTNLPVPLTPFIGREALLAAVCAQLRRDDVRLFTLTGVGGTGKTRLALEAARTVLPRFAEGAWFVDLAPVSDPAQVVTTMAQVLGVTTSGGKSLLAHLTDYLRAQQLLLLLDNCEHLLAAAPVLTALLTGAPAVKLLVTSRIVLHVYGEHEFAVPTFELPVHPGQQAPAHLAQNEAVALFVARAQAVNPTFRLTEDDAPAVAEICGRLDGLPLAIELAAARSKLVTPRALLERLTQPLDFLTGGARDLPARQQTIRATLDWSHSLLSPREQQLFRRLAVFVGGWTVDAAVAVCTGGDVGAVEVADGLDALIDHSLLHYQVGSGGVGRFRMLETLREYAQEQLEASGEAAVVRRQHLAYFCAEAETAELELLGPQAQVWAVRLEADYDNLNTALEWSLLLPGTAELGLRLVGAIYRFWDQYGRHPMLRAWLSRALGAAPSEPSAARAKALDAAGHLAVNDGDYGVARMMLQEALALARELGDRRLEARALWKLGVVAGHLGHRSEAGGLLDESLNYFRDAGDLQGIADVLSAMGYLERDLAHSEALFAESARAAREAGDEATAAWILGSGVGWTALLRGDVARAAAILQDVWDCLGGDAAPPQWRALMLRGMAEVALAQGELARAAAIYAEAVEVFRKQYEPYALAQSLQTLGRIAFWQGESGRARAYFSEGLAVLGTGWPEHRARMLVMLGEAAEVQGDRQRAEAYFAEALALFEQVSSVGGTALALRNLGDVALRRADLKDAERLLRESLRQFREQQLAYGMIGCMLSLADVAEQEGGEDRAARLWGVADALLRKHPPNAQRRECRPDEAARLATARSRLRDTALQDVWAAGRAMTLEEAIAYALAEAPDA